MLAFSPRPPPQIEEEETRAKAEYKEEREAAKAQAKHEKKWEKTRDERVGSWRDFVSGKAAKKQKTGGLKVRHVVAGGLAGACCCAWRQLGLKVWRLWCSCLLHTGFQCWAFIHSCCASQPDHSTHNSSTPAAPQDEGVGLGEAVCAAASGRAAPTAAAAPRRATAKDTRRLLSGSMATLRHVSQACLVQAAGMPCSKVSFVLLAVAQAH